MEVGRVIDANLNRLREGIRVIEDTLRYFHNDKTLSSLCKTLRHRLKSTTSLDLLDYRDIQGDVAKQSSKDELLRENLNALVMANFKRAQESARVLEEYAKLAPHLGDTHTFKQIRYELYDIEKQYFQAYCNSAL
ncbi:thiamine-phosphate pyrophosphorylase [Helicobacter labetoulli]|uniref:thiamine-phosphate pyrophosphorylase n=1 Tax=Helicobacter labetoulli TaxID=2315333 RepID=UPI000EF6B5CE|nr:thiamine-phosphate pyrophosphorylase [Helicobacter labetoulli]